MNDWQIFWLLIEQWFLTNYNQINLIVAFFVFGLLGITIYRTLKKVGYL
jgi:hypothetical protein